jgi:apolipoprotein N-acyltransferase
VLLAVGVRQTLRTGRGAVWAPRLLGLFGVAYIIGGLLRADPVAGFPHGTTPEMVHTTWQGAAQNASRGASSLLLIAASLVFAGWFACSCRAMIIAPDDDSREDRNTAHPPIVSFMQPCVVARCDPGPIP